MAINRTLPLDERIKAIREEINAVMETHLDQVMKDCPGVPREIIRRTIANEHCDCRTYSILQEKGLV